MKLATEYIDKNKERFLEELFDLLRIPSISAQPSLHKEDMVRCAEWLAASLVKAGADRAEVMPTEGNPVVYAEKIIDPKAKTGRPTPSSLRSRMVASGAVVLMTTRVSSTCMLRHSRQWSLPTPSHAT